MTKYSPPTLPEISNIYIKKKKKKKKQEKKLENNLKYRQPLMN